MPSFAARPNRRALLAAGALLLIAARPHAAEPLPVVASFSILADLVGQVGGARVSVKSIVGPDQDAHVYEPTPADARAVAAAKVMVVNGLGFEGWAERLMKAAGFSGRKVVASAAIKPLEAKDDDDHDGGHDHALDPHAWQDVAQVKLYVAAILEALVAADPAGAADYRANAQNCLSSLDALDAEIRALFAPIPRTKRRIVTSHDAFAYFGRAYGIEFLAPQGKNAAAEASAKQVATLIRQIRRESIRAVFIENMSNRKVIDQIARETGARIGGTLMADALGRGADSYQAMMRHNARMLAQALAD